MGKKAVAKEKPVSKSSSPKKTVARKSVAKKTVAKKAVKSDKPVKRKTEDISDQLLNAIVEGMKEKKASQIAILDLRNIHSDIADYFVICHASSRTQVDAIAGSIEEEVFKKLKLWPSHSEGYDNAEWILLDYFDVVAHVFIEEKRDFYRIEKLWADANLKFVND